MLYTKIQPQSFLGSGEEDFKEFLSYMDMVAILFNGTEHLNKLAKSFGQKAHAKSGENCKGFQRRRCLKITQSYTPI